MAKGKKAPGRLIGRWKEEAIKANPGASDADLAKVINETAKGQGYDYTITPEKVRSKAKKPAPARTPPPPAPASAPKPAPTPRHMEGALVEDLRAFVRLVGKDGAKGLVQEMIERL